MNEKYNTYTNKKDVLKRLTQLRKDVFNYAVELTLKNLDELIESVDSPNEKYGLGHVINTINEDDDLYVPSDEWVDEDED